MAPDTIKQYEIIEQLGAGAHATVYYARDSVLERSVVIKLLRNGTEAGDGLHARMLEEARLASAIEHPNVCAIYEVGVHDGQPFIVMQYVPGKTLRQFLGQDGLSLQVVLSLGIQIADGLAAAHRLGILHRDLKPENIMITDGAVKILDFGLARRKSTTPESEAPDIDAQSNRFGTTAYMAPEQFAVRRSSEQSDIFALGVILYETITGQHPFVVPNMDPKVVPTAIQSTQAARLTVVRPDLPEELEAIVLKALAKQPAMRFRSAQDLADALKAVMRSLQLDTGKLPITLSEVVPPARASEARPRSGVFSQLVGRLLPERALRIPDNSIALLPFQDLDAPDAPPLRGFTLSNAVATRLARVRDLVVRPLSAYQTVADRVRDPVQAGIQLHAKLVLLGGFTRDDEQFRLHWQLLDVAAQSIRTGGTVALAVADLADVQDRITEQIFSVLLTEGHLPEHPRPASTVTLEDLDAEVREVYLTARALLAAFAVRSGTRHDLERARNAYENVLTRAPAFAPAHAGLGTVYLRSARNGFGGVEHLRTAEQHLSRALELDPELVEAKLYRASTMIWAGDKESARLDLQYLLARTPADADVYLAAGVILQLDGLLEEALRLQGLALRLNPAVAPRAFYYRSRILLFQGKLDASQQEIDKGLAIAAGHTLLRHVQGFLHFQRGELDPAIAILEGVIADNPNLRIAYPTLAMCYARAGQTDRAAALITDELLDAAAADAETAYRLATYWVVIGDANEALAWLRRVIYLGNENYPWFATNPAWNSLRENRELQEILADLEEVHRLNRIRWEHVLAALPG